MDDATPGVAIPARYALNTALRRMRAIWDEGREDYWTREIVSMVKKRQVTGDGVEAAVRTIDPDIVVSMDVTKGRRLGRPSRIIDMIRMQPMTLTARDQSGAGTREIILLRRDLITQRDQEIEVRSGDVGIALDRHAAERIYQRERCTHDEIVKRLRDDLRGMVRAIAFCRASRIINGWEADGTSGSIRPGAAAFVPMGAGALIVEAMQVDVAANTSRRTLVKRPASTLKIARNDPGIVLPAAAVDGHDAVGIVQMVGMTYLSDDLLRPEQRDYLALFEDAMEEAGDKVDMAARILGSVAMAHEPAPALPVMPEPGERIINLLRRNVRRRHDATAWLELRPKKRGHA